MQRLLAASALFALALFTATATSQPLDPGGQLPLPKKGADEMKPLGEKTVVVTPTEAAIAAALANDPDVKMARAKIQLAEAELAKARQAVTLKVVSLKSKIDQLKNEVRAAEDRVAWTARMLEKGVIQQSQLLAERDKLEASKAALALAEAEWKLLTGSPVAGAAGDPNYDRAVAAGLTLLGKHQEGHYAEASTTLAFLALLNARERSTMKGPIPERIRAALDKPVKIGAKGEKVTFEKAMEVFKKEAGLDVPVRGTYPVLTVADPKKPNEFQQRPIEIVSEGEELPVGAWFQLLEDNAVFPQRVGAATRFRFYVRDYGLLISSSDAAPPDAPALTEFWKQKPKEEKTDTPKK